MKEKFLHIIKLITKPRITLSWHVSLCVVAFIALFLTLVKFYIQPIAFTLVVDHFITSNFLTLLLNYLPILLTMLLLFFVFNSIVLAAGVVGFVVILLSIINRFKIVLRNDPLFPWDFALGAEFLGVAASFPVYQFVLLGLFIFLSIFAIILGYCVVRTKKINVHYRIGLVIICVSGTLFINSTVYHRESLIASLPVAGNVFNQISTFNSRGFLYSFIFFHNTQRISIPANFDPAPIEDIKAVFVSADVTDMATPHIIMIMSEAFSEIAMDERFNFEGFRDPHYYWRQIIARDDVIHGNIVVPNLGGGTGDTEFDALTAFNTRDLRGVPYSYMLVTNYFEAIPHLLEPLGYRSIAMHPGFSWFYNRQNVFRFFGFEHFYSIDYFEYYHFKGPYISEWATMDKILDIWHRHLEDYPGVPLFNFTITIQNHGPYAGLYEHLPPDYVNFTTEANFSDHEILQLTHYFHGVIDKDEQLWRLFQYFMYHPEPVVMVYFSDHLPALNIGIYDILHPETYPIDRFENITRLHQAPFMIWQNHAAAAITPLQQNRETLAMPQDMVIGSNFLGAYTLELLGFTGLSPFWDHVNYLRTRFVSVLEDRSLAIDGRMSLEFREEELQALIIYRHWQFDRIFN
ncbi:MAG: LTA synthase family protein [Defluviitaleaceae bacterium]|nr:LTA synthase family protein [Defluviitaleaceae bacterium]